MTNKEKTDLYWAYAISNERIAKRLVEKGIAAQEDVDETLNLMYENIHKKDLREFSVLQGCSDIINTYLKKRASSKLQYVSLTDIAREKDKESPSYVIQGWLRSRNTIQFLRIWETANNPEFNESECDALLEVMKMPSFTVTPKKWITQTNARGLVSHQGKNGGTYAHPDIAGDFQMWMYPEFRMALIRQFRESTDESFVLAKLKDI